MAVSPAASPAAADSAEKLYSDITTVFPDLIADFNNKWTAWAHTWFPNERPNEKPNSTSVSPRSSSASDRCLVPEFKQLTALGPKIIPLVVYKLASEPQNFLGVQLYNGLEKDKNYLVNPADLANYKVLQRQANLIVGMNYDRNKLVQARIEAWKAHCMRSHVQSSSAMYTECQEYNELLELDGSIISHLMVAYSRDQTCFWFELLHEIVHGFGKKTGLRTIDFKQQYAAWNSWFQEMEHDKAPRWPQVYPQLRLIGSFKLVAYVEFLPLRFPSSHE
ncbi:hypothetical protein BDY21DRAFT_364962 [Lineolata rhizophorae]|uniref:Uncharacterized protein n=1 Tax=Lineolata rhizophorae TaxID=578093 RepID=A0A6A6NX20_9PEZI|nr:hypothetical protein BDY21DRAFT_364962 [Lineolata rhizophorae]